VLMSVATLRGIIDYKLGLTRHFYLWGSPMNGMTSRLEAVRQIIFDLRIECIVETGTFRGTTAEWFAGLGLPMETVEINERFYAFSKRRLAPFPNAKIALGSSVDFLFDRIEHKIAPSDARQLFYLDSHWENHLPLRQELELIFSNYLSAVVVIDDFQVPDDPGYGFDHYSEEDSLTLNYLSSVSLPRSLTCFYPSTKSEHETGARRGWIVVTDNPALAIKLENIRLLRMA
jgi:hypothetical protein